MSPARSCPRCASIGPRRPVEEDDSLCTDRWHASTSSAEPDAALDPTQVAAWLSGAAERLSRPVVPDYPEQVRARVDALRQRITDRDDTATLRAALTALTAAAERAVEPGWWTSPVRRAALADAAREARTTLNGDAQ